MSSSQTRKIILKSLFRKKKINNEIVERIMIDNKAGPILALTII